MNKKSRRSTKKKARGALLSFKKLNENIDNPRIILSLARSQNPISSFPELIKLIKLNSRLFSKSFNQPFPVSAENLERISPLYQTTFDRELMWAAIYLNTFSNEINEFLKLAYEFQKSLLLSNYKKCEEILSSIEANFGYSYWFIKNKIAFLQISKGLEEQKAFANSIREKSSNNPSLIAYFFSLLNEKNVTPGKYYNAFDSILEIDFSKEFKDYLKFHLRPYMLHGITELHNVLSYEAGGTVVDYYETYISICQIIVSSELEKTYPLVAQSLEIVGENINDQRIQYVLFESKDEYNFEPSKSPVDEALDIFFEGDFIKSYQFCKDTLMESPHHFDLIEIAAVSLSLIKDIDRGGGNTYLDRLIVSLASILNREDDVTENLANLVKITMCFPNFSWSQALNSFYWKENIFFTPELIDHLQHLTTVVTASFNPLRAFSFSDKPLQRKFLETIKRRSTQEDVIELCDVLLNQSNTFPVKLFKELRFLIQAGNFIRNEEYEEALSVLDEMIDTSYRVYKYQGIKLKTYCLFCLFRFNECLRLITESYFEEPNIVGILPIKQVVNSIDKKIRRELSSQLSLPIVLDVYSKHINSDKDTIKCYTYEDFLFSNGIQRPSELEPILNNFDKAQIIYFLRYLCVETVMDTSTVFVSSPDVTEERLKVCRMLVEIDPESTEIYRSEIKTLLRRLMVQEKITEIEQSKIYVDVDGIKKKLDRTMKESFERYISFLKNNISFNTESNVIKTVELVKNGDNNSLALVKISLPKNEMNDIFQQMIIEMRDEFVSSNIHGLDGYLSLRIRHGTLEGQLRKPLEDSKLITEKESTSGLYKPNKYWIDHLNIKDAYLSEKIIERLDDFARDFDELVQTIKNEWIQINKNNDGKGLFNFTLFEIHSVRLSKFVTVETTFEEFTNFIFDNFFKRLDENLSVVRETFDVKAKTRVNELLTTLQNDLEGFASFVDFSPLNNKIIAARTEMINVFNRIKEWFQLSSTTNNEPFVIDDAISIAEESLKSTSNKLTVSLTNEKDFFLIFPGNRLSNIVDIFYIIFENIIRHSKVEAPKAHITIKQEGDKAYVAIENKIGDNISIDTANDRISAIKLEMREGKYIKSMSREGGTGFHKIWKILYYELGTPGIELDFGFKNTTQFFVEIKLSLQK